MRGTSERLLSYKSNVLGCIFEETAFDLIFLIQDIIIYIVRRKKDGSVDSSIACGYRLSLDGL